MLYKQLSPRLCLVQRPKVTGPVFEALIASVVAAVPPCTADASAAAHKEGVMALMQSGSGYFSEDEEGGGGGKKGEAAQRRRRLVEPFLVTHVRKGGVED